jgi:phosphoadenosine phosphosulfate reductase
MGNTKGMEQDFLKYPKFKEQYLRTFDKLVQVRNQKGLKQIWDTGKDVFNWWLYGTVKQKQCVGQMDIEDMGEGE